ncbi:MAG: heavy metal translocating P-type ATPase, partial [Armatimonadota bacterium]
VPLVLLVSAGSFSYWHFVRGDAAHGAMSALSVLVVACPCALGLATPLVTSLGVGRAARDGVLIRSGEVLQRLCRVSRLFMDKTGTLTRGTMTVSDVACVGGRCSSPNEALAWLASLEGASEHAVARAIVAAADQAGVALGTVSEFRAFPGEGAIGRVRVGDAERLVAAGTAAFVRRMGFHTGDDMPPADDAGGTTVYAGWDGEVQAVVALSDAVRAEAREAVARLGELDIAVTVLSGDRQPVLRELARQLELDDVHGELTPDMKIAEVRGARGDGCVVGMVGDGINDAPALAEADVGIAMSGGTQLAKEAGDVTLLGDDLRRLPWCFGLARRVYQLIRQNLFWAFGYNVGMLCLAFFGLLHPLLAAVVMLVSSFLVLGNSLRLARHPGPAGR